MRIKLLTIYFFLSVLSLFAITDSAFAITADECNNGYGYNHCNDWSCSGPCGVANCISSKAYTTVRSDCQKPNNGGPGCWTVVCYDNSFTQNPDLNYITPVPGTFCSESCDKLCTNGVSCITEKFEQICNCPNPVDPTPTPTGDPTPTDPPTTIIPTGSLSFINGKVQEDNGAVASGNFCTQTTNSPLANNNYNLSVGSSSNQLTSAGTYETIVSTGTNYTVTLDLSAQTGLVDYVCSCPSAVSPDNPHLCRYVGVAPGSTNVNFYLEAANLANESWFQVFGGNLFGRTGIASVIPYSFCSSTNGCKPALSATNTSSTNLLSSGFPIVNTGNNAGVSSNDVSSIYHSYFHLPARNTNVNSYDVNTDLNQLSYDYFYKLAENSLQELGNGEDLEPLLSDWTNANWWINDDINYVKVNGNVNIDETQGFNLTSGQQLVVFVDGNLILDDSNTNDTNRKITSVTQGGFLAFIASGDIIVTADVGYELDPLNPSTPTVSNANSNLEGVFIAHNDLIIQSKTAIGEVPPDRKFIGAGTFVGWHDVLLNRTFDDNSFGPILSNSQAIENFVYRPDLLANWPVKLKASTSNWREVDPQFISQ